MLNLTRHRVMLLSVPLSLALVVVGCRQAGGQAPPATPAHLDFSAAPAVGETVERPDEEWREVLNPEQYRILRHEGTERAFTGGYWDHHEHGLYRCAGCGAPLFSSTAKFDSGTGWPSYTAAVEEGRVTENEDLSLGVRRVEIECAACGGHLGHVFEDGPPPTGLRYCVNSASLAFEPQTEGGEQ